LRIPKAEPWSLPQERNFLIGIFFLLAFSFVPLVSKEKAENNLGERYGCRRESGLNLDLPRDWGRWQAKPDG